MLLIDIIRAVISEPGAPVSTEELTALVVDRIPPDQVQAALAQALRSLVMQQRSKMNKDILREPPASPRPGPLTPAASATPGGMRYVSPRAALLEDALLQTSISGAGGRAIRLSNARIADLRMEIDASRRKGDTFLARANIFDDMLHEMADLQVRSPSGLPPESRRKYALRMRDLHG
jgi:hypothetical protein